MTERPIIFSAEMVRAILKGDKTQTRRKMKPQPSTVDDAGRWYRMKSGGESLMTSAFRCPYGAPGDALWVREAWRAPPEYDGIPPSHIPPSVAVQYIGDAGAPWASRSRHARFMPRWASRITLRITDVRVERLQDISEDDAHAEGFKARPFHGPWWQGYRDMGDGQMLHQQSVGDTPPDWMIEPKKMPPTPWLDLSARDAFRAIWMDLYGPDAWEANPWVWVIEFERVKP